MIKRVTSPNFSLLSYKALGSLNISSDFHLLMSSEYAVLRKDDPEGACKWEGGRWSWTVFMVWRLFRHKQQRIKSMGRIVLALHTAVCDLGQASYLFVQWLISLIGLSPVSVIQIYRKYKAAESGSVNVEITFIICRGHRSRMWMSGWERKRDPLDNKLLAWFL